MSTKPIKYIPLQAKEGDLAIFFFKFLNKWKLCTREINISLFRKALFLCLKEKMNGNF